MMVQAAMDIVCYQQDPTTLTKSPISIFNKQTINPLANLLKNNNLIYGVRTKTLGLKLLTRNLKLKIKHQV